MGWVVDGVGGGSFGGGIRLRRWDNGMRAE